MRRTLKSELSLKHHVGRLKRRSVARLPMLPTDPLEICAHPRSVRLGGHAWVAPDETQRFIGVDVSLLFQQTWRLGLWSPGAEGSCVPKSARSLGEMRDILMQQNLRIRPCALPDGHILLPSMSDPRPETGGLCALGRRSLSRWVSLFGFVLIFNGLLLQQSVADLPPHCLAKHVVGEWEVHEGLWQPCKHVARDLAELHDPFCGHTTPDKAGSHGALIPPNVSSNFHETHVSRLKLSADHIASFDDGSTGTWTMVYDEGLHFEVTAPRRRRFFSFFKYELAPDGKNTALSFCHTLMVGWSVQAAHQDSPESDLALSPPTYDKPEVVRWSESDSSRALPRRACWWAQKLNEDHTTPTNIVPAIRKSPIELPKMPVPREPDISQVIVRSQIHSYLHGKLSWKPTDNDFVVLNGRRLRSLREINEAAGTFRLKPSVEPTHVLGILSFTPPLTGSTVEPIWRDVKEFDWTNPDHVFLRLGRRQSAVPGAPDQGDCGSCYAITTSTILTSRQACLLWIRYFDRDDIFGKMHVSAMQGTNCNVYNQGCAGGYVFLALKFGHEHGFRTQQCVDEYSESTRHPSFKSKFSKDLQQCHDLGGQLGTALYSCSLPPARNALPESCKTQVRVSTWHYVGGTFGDCSPEEMQRELWENGPLAVSIEPSVEFMTYRQGVFQSPYNSIVQKGDNWAWEKVDHAVVVVGWGWAKHGDAWLPYWKVRNSWGPKWGEDGYARVVRGVNEMAIERVAVAADVLLYEGDEAILPSSENHASLIKEDSNLAIPTTHKGEAEEIRILAEDYSVAVPELLQLGLPSGEEQISKAFNANSAAGASVTTEADLRPIKHH
ncbi:hypothetical protein Esti_005108 [Eimeria stiedai]